MKRFNGVFIALLLTALAATAASIAVPSGHKSIADAMAKSKAGDTVWVDSGTYHEQIAVNPGVVLKSRALFGAVLEGKDRGTIVTLGHGSVNSGFEVRSGTVEIGRAHV
jgi:nitrous oxidase accessory protein NosD